MDWELARRLTILLGKGGGVGERAREEEGEAGKRGRSRGKERRREGKNRKSSGVFLGQVYS